MVYINVVKKNPVVLDCYKNSEQNGYFRLVIDPDSLEIIERPLEYDIDASVAYSRILGYLTRGESLPEQTTAEWG